MRLFNGTAPGLPLTANDHIEVGDLTVEFHPSIYTTRGATFGTSLMFATLTQDLQGILHLRGCPVDSHQITGLDALVRLKLNGPARAVDETVGRARLALPHVVRRSKWYGGEFPHEYSWEEFHALVVMPRGSQIKLSYIHQNKPQKQGFWDWLLQNPAPSPEPAVTVITTIAYDGDEVTINTTRSDQD